MYLKAIEIQGFKSFPDRTVLTFGSDITAIVGPNGSGKSNISDAIRWVMGEMSTKALRGSKMEDVIFGGTVKRAQVGFAEVSLILDNSEHLYDVESSEVMVTRRYYRSGDSEYYINKQTARLRDINEMFMDTGLGKEGYCNIGQGRIDEILSAKSTDRREIFEEAAGISKYRHRKEETERKLAQTADNLVRINDKISELELQVVPLRDQAEKARKYIVLHEEQRGLEVTVWMQQLQRLGETARKAEEDYNSARFILEQGKTDLEDLYKKAERISEELRIADVKLERLRTEISEKERERADHTSDVAVRETQKQGNESAIRRIENEMTAQAGRADDIESQISAGERRLTEITTEKNTLARRVLEQQQLLSVAQAQLKSHNTLLSEQRQKLSDVQTQATKLRTGLSADEQSTRNLTDRRTEILSKQEESRTQLGSIQQQAENAGNKLTEARERVQTQNNIINGYTLKSRGRLRKRQELQEQADRMKISRDTLDARIRMYREMEQGYEGYSKATKIVMQESRRGTLKHIHGPVSALLRTDDDYALAIETALGASAGSIVVDTEQDGKAGIQLLKRRDGGRATFLPISTIRGRILQENGLEGERGFEGIASELVRFDPAYREIMVNLLGRTVIAENMDCAIAIAGRHGHRFRIVTLDGQILNAGGSMTGGSTAKTSGVLTRANELARMEENRAETQRSYDSTMEQLRAAEKAAAEAEAVIDDAKNQLRTAEDTVLRLEQQLKGFESLISTHEAAIESAGQELETVEALLSGGRDHITELQDSLRACEAEISRVNLLLGETELETGRLQCEADGITERVNEILRSDSALDAEAESVQGHLEELRRLLEGLSGDSEERLRTIEAYRQDNLRLDEEISIHRAAAAQLMETIGLKKDELERTGRDRLETEARRTRNDKEAQQKNRDINDMERECLRLEQKRDNAGLEEKQILDKMWDSYELTHETAAALVVEIESMAQAQRRIAELKRKIHGLGHINPGAIEEFERVNERYVYLTGQRDDVENSRRELQKIVNGITGEMTTIFSGEFKKINEYFGQTFTEMFRGGKASLELEDESDILSCGIEIRVQPPGKQVKSITLLSGGEKAFVAIALYFAIMKVRPTPFCMLDEIDAALDDQNVARFAAYLRNLSKRTQFIVITHRRGTMEAADVLYGVTMQEQGISRVLSVDLNQVVKELNIN